MAFIDGNNGDNFIGGGTVSDLIHSIMFYCPIHKQNFYPQDCYLKCSAFIGGQCMYGVERIFKRV